MKLIGITGGVGAGKSAILSYIGEHYSCKILLADEVAHIVKEPGQKCYYELIDILGQDIVDENGQIHKSKMAERIFASADLLQKVNASIHPAVKEYLLESIAKERKKGEIDYFFIEAALLIECGYKEIVDELWYVYADPMVRCERLKLQRNYTEEKAWSIIGKQLSDEEFRKNCDFVIDNSTTLECAFKQIKERLKEYEG